MRYQQSENEPPGTMKTKFKDEKADELRPEYDLAALLKEGVRASMPSVMSKGQTSFYCRRMWQGISRMMKQ
jgi:hypothetical protein